MPGPWREEVCFLLDVRRGKMFRVDTATDMLTDAEMRQHTSLVKEADRREIKSFIQDKVFSLKRRSEATVRPMDCIWVREWKTRFSAQTRGEFKSRRVVRGFLGPRKRHVSPYASTAARLSQRLLVCFAVEGEFELEQWDIGSAILEGFGFNVMRDVPTVRD